jgi:hypothetical protein
MNQGIREQIIEQIDRLDEAQRQKLLSFARRLTVRRPPHPPLPLSRIVTLSPTGVPLG